MISFLGVSCWPYGAEIGALSGMLTYSLLVTFYLLYVAVGEEWVGPLLWPVVALHAVLTVLLARAWVQATRGRS